MRRCHRAALPALAFGILILASGCDRSDAPSVEEGGEPERGGTAVIAEVSDMNRPVPLIGESPLDPTISSSFLFRALLTPEWRDGRLVFLTAAESPLSLARRYEFSGADSSVLRYHLRSDVRWTDGAAVTARDAAFTYAILGDPELASPLQGFAERIDSVVVENDSTVAFHFDRRYPEMLFHTNQPLLPEHVFRDVPSGALRDHPSILDPVRGKLVTNGPFVVRAWERGTSVTLARNPDFQPEPYLDQVVVRIIPEATTRAVELQTGGVDMALVAFDQIAALRAQAPAVRIVAERGRNYEYFAYNPAAHPAFADPEVRRALGMALDVPTMIRALDLQDHAVAAGGPYPPLLALYHDARAQAPLAFDSAGARRILEARGWRDTDGDGIREKDGRPLRFRVTSSTNARRADAFQVAEQQWRAVGVEARLEQIEGATAVQRLVERDFEVALSAWSVGLGPDIRQNWMPGEPYNIVDYENPEVVRLFETAAAQPTEDAAAPHWKAAAARIVRDQPYTWLYYYDAVSGVNERLRGVRVDALGRVQNPWEWWIPRARRPAG